MFKSNEDEPLRITQHLLVLLVCCLFYSLVLTAVLRNGIVGVVFSQTTTSEGAEMGEDTTYNGWKNYETWNVNLWLNNDEALYNEVRDWIGSQRTIAVRAG